MKVGLLFGSFNPIHTGHLIIANHVAGYYADKIWFIVSPHNPFKKIQGLLNAPQRLALVKLAVEEDSRFECSDVEFNLPTPSYTINTLRTLSKKHPQNKFFLIIGSDNVAGLSNWKSSDEILSAYKLLIYERPGFPIETNLHANIEIIKAPLLNISSTYIRTQIKENKSIYYLVAEKVRKAIETNGYYK
jgi:nicotinate-nucleotide adenylyltransferase